MRNDFKRSLEVHEEIIDGVRVLHTGITYSKHKGYRPKFPWEKDEKKKDKPKFPWKSEGHVSLGYQEVEILGMYDTNGNRFCSNCSSLKEAQKLVKKLKANGKDAIIGPKAPWRDPAGNLIKNEDENAVGVYIVKAIEEQQESNYENKEEIGE